MESEELISSIKRRTKELDRIFTVLQKKLENTQAKIKEESNKENTNNSMYEEIINELKEKILDTEKDNREIKKIMREIEQQNKNMLAKSVKESEDVFYKLNNLEEENKRLKLILRENQRVDPELKIKFEILSRNYCSLMEEYKLFKGKASESKICVENVERNNNYGDLIRRNSELEETVMNMENTIANLENSVFKLENLVVELKQEKIKIENDYFSMANAFKECENKRDSLEISITESKKMNENLKNTLKNLENKLKSNEMELHLLKNEIIDLKGNIRVFCRIRPSLEEKTNKFSLIATENSVLIDKNEFMFDKIFDPAQKQERVYKEIEFLIHSIFEGYNSCIFAYGQTGSGKTYTMEGDKSNMGIIPRAIEEIFMIVEQMKNENWAFNIILNYIEIYNETINDLLSENEHKYEIKHENNQTYIKNCTYIEIHTKEDAYKLLKIANKNRSTGITKCNNRSSRSHSVFILNINMKRGEEERIGVLTLIDLAGSERLSESGAEGIRLRETQNINKSLSALGNVITALLKNDGHVPYRNSKLTYLLQNYLSGKSRVLMFVNVSPEFKHLNETLCSLRFASKVSECKLGSAAKNVSKKL